MKTKQAANDSDRPAIARVLQRATELADAGRSSEAVEILDRAVDRHGDLGDLHTARGWALENTAPPRWAEALAAYRAALAVDAAQLWARLGQATALERLGEVEAAADAHADAARQAAARATAEPEFLELIGWCEYRLGRLDDAVVTFGRALTLDPTWTAVRMDLGLVGLVRGDDDARAHYDEAVDGLARLGPRQRMGALQVAIDDLDDAITAAAALARDPRAQAVRSRLTSALAAAR